MQGCRRRAGTIARYALAGAVLMLPALATSSLGASPIVVHAANGRRPPSLLVTSPPTVAGELDLRVLRVHQDASRVVWSFQTTRSFMISHFGRGRRPCLTIRPRGVPSKAQELCIVGRTGRHALFRMPIGPRGPRARFVRATIVRPTSRSARITFRQARANLTPGRWNIQMTSVWTNTSTCPSNAPCRDALPHSGTAPWRIDHYAPAGCIAQGSSRVFSGSSHRKRIALTFDDGPGAYTRQVLAVLRAYGVHATFFELGREVAAHPAAARAVLAEGSVIGNHSWSHPILTSANLKTQVSRTQAAIARATRYTPCLARPPYGSASPAIVAETRKLGLLSIIWDVDPRDWSNPGTQTIVHNVLHHAHPGAIVIMHDGGGGRDETVAALKTIIPRLQARGYQLVTVRALLGLPTLWRYFP
jgi:peptidoglycan-N-acetylglucosamine deacetylase